MCLSGSRRVVKIFLHVTCKSRSRRSSKSKIVKSDLLPGEFFGAGEGEVGVGRFVHDESCERDGIFYGGQARNGAAPSPMPIHDTRFHLRGSFRRQGRSTAGIEERIGFKLSNLYNTKPIAKWVNYLYNDKIKRAAPFGKS